MRIVYARATPKSFQTLLKSHFKNPPKIIQKLCPEAFQKYIRKTGKLIYQHGLSLGSRGVQRTSVCLIFVALGAPEGQNGPKTSTKSLQDPPDQDFS